MRAIEQEISVDQHPKARILLGLWIFSLVSLVIIFLGSNEDGSVSVTNITHKFYRTKPLILPPSLSPLPSPSPSPSLLPSSPPSPLPASPPPPSPPPPSSPPPLLSPPLPLLSPPSQPPPPASLLPPPSLMPNADEKTYGDELEEALAKAATEDKTVILAIANKAYTEGDKPMLDIFLDGLWLGEGTHQLTKHLLVVAVDQTAFDHCNFLQLNCYKLETEGVNFAGEKLFMSEDFIKMMWRRTLFLGDVLKHGYNFIFTDMDVLWLRNPFPRLMHDETLDLQISVDKYNSHPLSERNPINTGFYMIRSNNKTIALYDEWYGLKDRSAGKIEQDVLFDLMRAGAFRRLGLRVLFLDTMFFSGFCQDSRNIEVVTTVHANCCRSIRAKLTDLTAVIHDWKKYKASPRPPRHRFRWSVHRACRNSWRRP